MNKICHVSLNVTYAEELKRSWLSIFVHRIREDEKVRHYTRKVGNKRALKLYELFSNQLLILKRH